MTVQNRHLLAIVLLAYLPARGQESPSPTPEQAFNRALAQSGHDDRAIATAAIEAYKEDLAADVLRRPELGDMQGRAVEIVAITERAVAYLNCARHRHWWQFWKERCTL